MQYHAGAAEGVGPCPDKQSVFSLRLGQIVNLESRHEDGPIPLVKDGPGEPGFLQSLKPAVLQIIEVDRMIHVSEGVEFGSSDIDRRECRRHAIPCRGPQ